MQSVLMRSRGRNLLLRLFLSGRTTRTGTEEEEEEAPRMAGSSRGSGGGAETSFQIIIIWGGGSIGSIVCQGGKKSVYKIGFEKVYPALAKSYNTAKQKKNQETFFIGLFHLSQLFDPVEHPYEVRQEARALVGHGDHGEAGSDDVIVRRHLGVGGAEVGLPGPEIGQSCKTRSFLKKGFCT